MGLRYGYGPVYDDNMGTIREWIADAGLAVRTDFDKVRDWPLGDDLHFAASVKDTLAHSSGGGEAVTGGLQRTSVDAKSKSASRSEAWHCLSISMFNLSTPDVG